jgi:hypothetical protein
MKHHNTVFHQLSRYNFSRAILFGDFIDKKQYRYHVVITMKF